MYGMAEVLKPQFITEEYRKISSASVDIPFLDFFVTPGNTTDKRGDQIELTRFEGERRAAPINARGSVARAQTVKAGRPIIMTPVHSFNEITLPSACYEFLRGTDSQDLQEKGADELERHMADFGFRQKIAKGVHLSKILFDGVVYYDVDGGILENSTGATITIDYAPGATHKDQLAHASNGDSDIIDAAWDVASTKIMAQLDKIRIAAEEDMVPEPRHVWLNPVAKQWFRGNTEMINFITLNSPRAEEFLLGMGDTLNFPAERWTFHFSAQTYVGADGSTVRQLLSTTKAAITPDPGDPSGGGWLRNMNMDQLVPTTVGIFKSVPEALAAEDRVFGDFAYLYLTHNAPGVNLFLGTNYHHGIPDVNAIWLPTVDF